MKREPYSLCDNPAKGSQANEGYGALRLVCVKDEEELEELDEGIRQQIEINVAFKTIQILGQLLRNFPGSLVGEQKLSIAKEAYSLGLRVLKFMYESIENNREELLVYLKKLLKSNNPSWSDEKLNDSVGPFAFAIAEGLSLVVTKQISDSVGMEKLPMTFEELLRKSDNISNRFVDLSVKLDHYTTFPEKEAIKLHSDVSKFHLPKYLVRHLVWQNFYLYPSKYDVRQRMCKKLDIAISPAELYDKKLKQIEKPKKKERKRKKKKAKRKK